MSPERLASPGPLTARSTRVREARRLSRRSVRDRSGSFLVEGPQGVREALRRPDILVELFATDEATERHAPLLTAARSAGARVHRATDEAVTVLAETVTPQGLVAVCRSVTVPLPRVLRPGARLVAVLAGVRDPGNAGTVVRTADAAGADGVVLTEGSVDVHNGKAVRATAGSVFHLPIAERVALPVVVGAARDAGLTVVAADSHAKLDLDEADGRGVLSQPTAWVFGNEAHGLSASDLALADAAIRVPIYGRAESLNLATAAAVCLYASARAHRQRDAGRA